MNKSVIITLLFITFISLTLNAQAIQKKALVVYDNEKEVKYINRLAYLLKHFEEVNVYKLKQENYKKSQIEYYDKIIHLGLTYKNPSKVFIDDICKTKKDVFWIQKNLEFLTRYKRNFINFRRDDYSRSEYQNVFYKKTMLPKYNKGNVVVKIGNVKKVKVIASAVNDKDKSIPYLLKQRNFHYIADNPFEKALDGSSHLAFADYLHDFLDIKHKNENKALVRIEDVHPNIDKVKVKRIIDYLYYEEIPFAIAVTPVYKKDAKSKPIYGSKDIEFKELIKYAQKKGGIIVVHGYTHQYKGTTCIDAEFWDTKTNKPLGAGYTYKRAKLAMVEMKKMGVEPNIWETPHYLISDEAHRKIAPLFSASFEREENISLPYFIEQSRFGQKVIPENLGYFDKSERNTLIPLQISENALRNKVVRDSYSVFFFHPGLSVSLLRETVRGIKSHNIGFVSPNNLIGENVPAIEKPDFINKVFYNITDRASTVTDNLSIFAIISIMFTSYYLVIFGLSKRAKPIKPVYDKNLFYIFLIPALNEAKVIKSTVLKLLELKHENYMILVADDNSADDTVNIVKSTKSSNVKILRMPKNNCQKGKGHVLNKVYREISRFPQVKKYGRENIIIGVIDADGRVDNNIKEAVSGHFKNKKVGAVQTGVKIINGDANLLTRWQDYEFRVFCYIFQSARSLIGSVGLGGNGQFIRLKDLDSLAPKPWTDCLTEDLDIGIRLLLKGWRNAFCKTSFVWQQGLEKFKPLIKQRTRWFQGHITCWRHLWSLGISDLPLVTKLDVSYYLIAIALTFVVVPANYLALVYIATMFLRPEMLNLTFSIHGIKYFLVWYILYFGAIPVFVYSYWKSSNKNLISAYFLTHVYLFVSVVWLISAYIALYRHFTGKTNWAKTKRLALKGKA